MYMHTLVAVVLFGFGLGCSSFREAAMALARASSSSQLVGLAVVGKENTTFILWVKEKMFFIQMANFFWLNEIRSVWTALISFDDMQQIMNLLPQWWTIKFDQSESSIEHLDRKWKLLRLLQSDKGHIIVTWYLRRVRLGAGGWSVSGAGGNIVHGGC